jgi:hypothetical protein
VSPAILQAGAPVVAEVAPNWRTQRPHLAHQAPHISLTHCVQQHGATCSTM